MLEAVNKSTFCFPISSKYKRSPHKSKLWINKSFFINYFHYSSSSLNKAKSINFTKEVFLLTDSITEANSSLSSPYHCENEIEVHKTSIGTSTEKIQDTIKTAETVMRTTLFAPSGKPLAFSSYGVIEKGVQTSFDDKEDVVMEDINAEHNTERLGEAESQEPNIRINTILEDDVEVC